MTDPKNFSVRVTEDHLNTALALFNDLNHEATICNDCILAVAVKPILGKGAWVAENAVAKNPIDYYVHEWAGDQTAALLVRLFDGMYYDDIRKMLPVDVSFTLTRETVDVDRD